MKKKESKGIGQKLCHALELSPEVLPRSSSVEIHGRAMVKIWGGGRILLYTDSEIQIALGKKEGAISVRGAGLSCSSYNMGAVGIEGRIDSVSFCEVDE